MSLCAGLWTAFLKSGAGDGVVIGAFAGIIGVGLLVALASATVGRTRRLAWRADSPSHAVIPLGDAYPGAVEIDATWPGRTRLRVPALQPLPMLGPARLTRAGRRWSLAPQALAWTGRGRDDAVRWDRHLRPHLTAIHRGPGRGRMQATLSPGGLIVHLPLVVPNATQLDLLLAAGRGLAGALTAVLSEPDHAGIRLAAPVLDTGACACCWEPVSEPEAVTCEACGARQHRECAEWLGGCGRFACAAGSEVGKPLA